ncbi:MAG: cytochrome c [Anaerolineae bacterium]|nr:cytochrome c [Anaerolineae bacterium]MDW8172872.1 c-type cytochrome [Anaerolineae bacterium]
MRRSLPAFIFIALLTACSGLAGEPQIIATLPPPLVAQAPNTFDLERGARLYAANCTSCHGVNGNGRGELVLRGQVPSMPSFLDEAHMRQQTLEGYYAIITNGNLANLMPPWRDSLSEAERWDVAQYVFTLWQNLPTPEATEAAEFDRETFDVVGQVSNGTAGGLVPPGLRVFLRYGNQTDGLQSLETTIDAAGRFRFDGVPYNAAYGYVALARHNDRNFASAVVTRETIRETVDLPITLYELTEDPFSLKLRALDMQIEPFQQTFTNELTNGLLITQTMVVNNNSDRVFSLGRAISQSVYPSLLVQLPPGAIILSQSPTLIVAQEQYAVIDTTPILPGDHRLQVVYFLPYDDGALIDLPLNMTFEGTATLVTSPKTLQVGPPFALVQADAPMVNVYQAEVELSGGEALRFELSGRAVQRPVTPRGGVVTVDSLLPILALGLAAIAVALFGLAWWSRRRAPDREIDVLTRQIAHLDALHDEGRINHDAYQRQRAALKARLAVLLARQERLNRV